MSATEAGDSRLLASDSKSHPGGKVGQLKAVATWHQIGTIDAEPEPHLAIIAGNRQPSCVDCQSRCDQLHEFFRVEERAVLGVGRIEPGCDTEVCLVHFIVALAAACAAILDTHMGLIVILLLAAEWVVRVDDALSAWSIGIAALIGVFHTALTFAGIAPAGARLRRSIYVPWIRRGLLSIGLPVVAWAAVVALSQLDLGGHAVLVAAALIALAIAGYWSTGSH